MIVLHIHSPVSVAEANFFHSSILFISIDEKTVVLHLYLFSKHFEHGIFVKITYSELAKWAMYIF